MVSRDFSNFVCILFVFVVPPIWATYCRSYWDKSGNFHDNKPCGGLVFCCGECNHRYCCSEKNHHLTKEKQDLCPSRSGSYRTGVVVGSIVGTLFPFIICVGVLICCLAPCCWCYKKCRKRRSTRHRTMVNTTVVQAPPPVPSSPGYQPPPGFQPSYPLYQPSYPGYVGPPLPTAPPPSYQESMNPAHSPVAFSQGQVMYNPHQPSSPAYSDEYVQLPFNPSYQPQP